MYTVIFLNFFIGWPNTKQFQKSSMALKQQNMVPIFGAKMECSAVDDFDLN